MAHFYGTLQGSRGRATRCGTKASGMETVAASWAGAVAVRLWRDETTGQDMAEVALTPWHGRGVSRVLYTGPVDGAAVPCTCGPCAACHTETTRCAVCGRCARHETHAPDCTGCPAVAVA